MIIRRIKQSKWVFPITILILIIFFVVLNVYKNDLFLWDKKDPIVEVPVVTDPNLSTTTPSTVATSTDPLTTPINIKPSVPIEVGHEMGIAAGSKLIGLSDAELNKDLAGMVDLGVKWVRFDVEWGFVQYGSKDKYDWSRYDRIINALNKYNLKALPILTYTPEWARVPGCRGGAHCPPADPKTFAKFATDAIERYKGKGVHYWEIWNEPNSYDFWATKADCKAYTNLLKATYPAMKKADPSAFIITGGLAMLGTTDVNIAPLEFIECIYTNGGKNYFDAIGYHPYTFPALPSANGTAWAKMSLTSPSLRSIMLANGDSAKKVWLTEYGAPTGGPDSNWFISEDKQSQMVTDTMNLYKPSTWAGPLFWYTYIDSGNKSDTNENFFGFVRFNGTQKPAFSVLKKIISGGI